MGKRKRHTLTRTRRGRESPFATLEKTAETARLVDGGGGGREIGAGGCDDAFLEMQCAFFGGGAGPDGAGGAIFRRAGELVRIAGEPLAEVAPRASKAVEVVLMVQ